MFYIIDDFIHKDYHSKILELLDGSYFPWYLQKKISYKTNQESESSLREFGFGHIFADSQKMMNTEEARFIEPLLIKIGQEVKSNKILRSRADMTMYGKFKHDEHVDFTTDHITTIYYVNESDGDTILYNEFYDKEMPDKLTIYKRISPRANRLIVFDGLRIHTGCSPESYKNRIIINSNYER